MGEVVRRESLLSTHFIKFKSRFKSFDLCRFAFVFSISIAMLSQAACTNVGSGSANLSNNVGGSAGDNLVTTVGGAFKLDTVLPTQSTNGATYDMIGEGAQFDNFCAGTYGTCKCVYTYTPHGSTGTQTIEADITYSESNLLRCDNTVPSGVGIFTAQIVVYDSTNTPTPYSSNTITVSLSSGAFSGSTTWLDLSSSASYVQVQRFQCRKREFIANPLDNNGNWDPFQSQDPEIIYPFNFFSTNVADSLLHYQQSADQSWDCSISYPDTTPPWWSNPYVYSSSNCVGDPFCGGDQELMYPTANLSSGKIVVGGAGSTSTATRRASFYLATQPYGVFQTPLKAAIAPSGYLTSKFGQIGYAAQPVPNNAGSTSCPNIALPPNATWVKLWNFRATNITAPKHVYWDSAGASSQIVCHTSTLAPGSVPGCDVSQNDVQAWPALPSNAPGFPFDSNPNAPASAFGLPTYSVFGENYGALDSLGASTVASRMVCNTAAGDCAANSIKYCANIEPVNSAWTSGVAAISEEWRPSPYGYGGPLQVALSVYPQLPWNMYDQVMGECQGYDGYWRLSINATPVDCTNSVASPLATPFPSPTTAPTPNPIAGSNNYPKHEPGPVVPIEYNNGSTMMTADFSNGQNYSDQIFIITDQNVNDTQIRNQVGYDEYIPVTYRSINDCSGPSRVGCVSNQINWQVNVNAVDDPNSGPVYPLCVLQFYQ